MKELKGRKLILILGVPLGIGCLYIGNPIFAIVTTLIMLLGLDEFFKMCELKGSYPNRIFGFILTVFIGLAYSGVYAHDQITVLGLACMTVISLFIIEIVNNKKEPLHNIANTVLGVIFVPILLGSLIHLRQLDHIFDSNITLLLFISVWLCDTAAFFFGTKFGKKKILPNISPKKSWVGSISGFIFSMLTFFIAYKLDFLGQTYSLADCIIFGFISGVFGQLGDFGESLLKRDVGVKDSGDILRGHGGILDRFDSLLFSSPLIYIYLIVFNQ
jgi:phosphatidate cytidylyltransferase